MVVGGGPTKRLNKYTSQNNSYVGTCCVIIMYSITFTTITIGMVTIKIMVMMMMIMWCLWFYHNNVNSGSDIGNDSLVCYNDNDDDIAMKKMRISLKIWWRSDHSDDDSSDNYNDIDAGGATVNNDDYDEGCLRRHNNNFWCLYKCQVMYVYLHTKIAKLRTRYSHLHLIQYINE